MMNIQRVFEEKQGVNFSQATVIFLSFCTMWHLCSNVKTSQNIGMAFIIHVLFMI